MGADGRYKMGTFSRLTGFSPSVLRAWERRHGLLSPVRVGGRHRFYTDDDLRVMRRVRQLLETGRAIGEIAAAGRRALLTDPQAEAVVAPTASAVPEPLLHADQRRGPSRIERLRADIVRAAIDLDAELLRRSLDETFGALSPLAAIDRVISPAAREIGGLWADGTVSVAGEHLVSSQLVYRVRQLFELAGGAGRPGAPVLLACLPEETHELGLLVVGLHLATAGRPVVHLGARVPVADLERSCETLGPLAVCLSVTCDGLLSEHAPRLASFARTWAPTTTIVIGGAGATHSQPELAAAGVRLWPAGADLTTLVQTLATR